LKKFLLEIEEKTKDFGNCYWNEKKRKERKNLP